MARGTIASLLQSFGKHWSGLISLLSGGSSIAIKQARYQDPIALQDAAGIRHARVQKCSFLFKRGSGKLDRLQRCCCRCSRPMCSHCWLLLAPS